MNTRKGGHMSLNLTGKRSKKNLSQYDDDLFSVSNEKTSRGSKVPLADRMRPRNFNEFVGQEHIVGKGRLLRRAVEADELTSIILWGPPGTVKTAIVNIIAHETKATFVILNAVLDGVKELREVVATAISSPYNTRTHIFFY